MTEAWSEYEIDEKCPKCGLVNLLMIDGDCNDIYYVDHIRCPYCNYRENREREILPTPLYEFGPEGGDTG